MVPLTLIRRFGNAYSDALLDPRTQFFEKEGILGVIGYRISGNYAIVFGDPLAESPNKERLAEAFSEFCRLKELSALYLMSSKDFAEKSFPQITPIKIELGEKLRLDPKESPFEHSGNHGSLVRRKVRHALGEGAEVFEYLAHDEALEKKMEEVGNQWLKRRWGPQAHISDVRLFDYRTGKRWFYAQVGKSIVGVVVLNAIESKEGWHLNHLMFSREAPHGIGELLVIRALEKLNQEGCRFLSVGFIAKNRLGSFAGLGKISSIIVPWGYQIARKVLRLKGLNDFWGKFDPKKEPAFLLFTDKKIEWGALWALRSTLT
jgi:lysylphosphatidylglycerol synthetase-like protein (DUF2156 family)